MTDSLHARITGNDVNTAYRRGYVHGAVRMFEVVKELSDSEVVQWLDELMQWRDQSDASFLHPPAPPERSRHHLESSADDAEQSENDPAAD
ncbi:MAG: hypothetical protein AB8G96_13780 [Phycisphaerales bacterium]